MIDRSAHRRRVGIKVLSLLGPVGIKGRGQNIATVLPAAIELL